MVIKNKKEQIYSYMENNMKDVDIARKILIIFEWVFMFLAVGTLGEFIFPVLTKFIIYGIIWIMTIYLIVINNKVKKKKQENYNNEENLDGIFK